MLIGSMSLGKTKEFKGQYFQTRFFILGIPLMPTDGYFIIDDVLKRGFECFHWQSIVAGYFRMISWAA